MGGEVIKSPKGPEFGCKLFDFTNPCHTEDQRTLRLYLTHSDIVSKVPEGYSLSFRIINAYFWQSQGDWRERALHSGHVKFFKPSHISR